MNKRKPLDKVEARERRNRMLASAAEAKLPLTDGVREMRAIAGMTQEDFARHRGVSARVVKALELGQGNPTVATLNRIGAFFGLEVAFVSVRRPDAIPAEQPFDAAMFMRHLEDTLDHKLRMLLAATEQNLETKMRDALDERTMARHPRADQPATAKPPASKRKARGT